MLAVLKHELSLYYHSLSGYVFGAFLLAFTGIGALIYNINASVANFEYVLSFIQMVFIIIVPILTMRIIADEKRQRTDQLLYSLPIRTSEIVVGKFLALLVVFIIPMLVICLYPLIFSMYGEVYLPTSYGSIFAFVFLGLALISIGMYISSLTESQGMAAGICVVIMLLNYFCVQIANAIPNETIQNIIAKISLFQRFSLFYNGIFDLTAIVYYISIIAFFLFLCVQSLEKRRYNG
ncbi:ABC-2 type transport system permease protein [Pseudobutyrivibrio sp. 49]|uniref:ABC transporter permease n=1 Tax=unclassified Pseudobutyrivibrio TaxID=2638619 RepID=UPI00088F3996|nr:MULTISPECIES: ABC transporter permease [unclassified Pseudobutyrivibrio]SDH28866.1 ABC-2 type transport system permease protein [Pseudobutyrivibrio sp. 49]SFN52737.1 ABC-2 type transport system permease protein [Pseudobutyrivibrio sp. UC1225]